TAAGAGADAGGGAAGSAPDLPAGPGGANRPHRVGPDGPVHLGRPENPRPRARAPCYPQSRTVVGTQPSIWIRSERRADSRQVLIASRPPGPDRGPAAPPSLPRIKQAGVWTPSVFYSVLLMLRFCAGQQDLALPPASFWLRRGRAVRAWIREI